MLTPKEGNQSVPFWNTPESHLFTETQEHTYTHTQSREERREILYG